MSWLFSLVNPAWFALTAAQRTAWGTFAAANPYINSRGALVSTSGYNLFASVNTWLLTTDEDDHLVDPPANLDPPPRTDLHATALRTKAKLADGTTRRHGKLFLVIDTAPPANTLWWLRNLYRWIDLESRLYKQPHKLTYVRPGESGTIDLTTFRGLPTPGPDALPQQTIIGVRARRLPNRSAAQVVTVDMTNGQFTIGTLFHDH